MDAITLLKNDHRTVEELFKRFERLGPRALKGKEEAVERIVRELAVHAFIEETVFYPAVRAATREQAIDGIVLESLEEHHIVKWTLSELDKMRPDDERYTAKMSVMAESVRHHVQEEEGELFPKVRKLLGRERLDQIGEAMAEAKKSAPTHAHPRSPDEPPGNLLAAPAALLVDKARDVGRMVLGSATGGTKKAAREAGRKAGSMAGGSITGSDGRTGSTTRKAPPAARKTAKKTGTKTGTKSPTRSRS